MRFRVLLLKSDKLKVITLTLATIFLFLFTSVPAEAWLWGLWGKKIKEISNDELREIKRELNVLEDPRFHFYSDSDLKEALDKEMDKQEAPGLTYGIHILNAINEETLVNLCSKSYFDDREASHFFSIIADNLIGWQKNFAEKTTKLAIKAIIEACKMHGLGIGTSTLLLAVDLVQIDISIKKLEEVIRNRALWHYIASRKMNDSHEGAWGTASVPVKYRNKQTEEYFKSLWDKYGEYISEDGLDENFKQQQHEILKISLLYVLGARAYPVITSPLKITPSQLYHVGDKITAEFTITNKGALPIFLKTVTVGGHYGDKQEVIDFTKRHDIKLDIGESYNYKETLTLTKSGKHHFFSAYQTRDGNWNTSIDLSSGLTDEDRIEDIVVKVKEEETKLIKLYFSDSQGQNLIPEERKILALPQINQEAKEILKELIKGPLDSSLKPTIPLHTEVRAVYVKGDRFYVDFSSSLREKHPGGSDRELLIVYSIVNTLLINFPSQSRVQILIQGKPAETLAGHIDIRSPLGMRLDIVKEEVKRIGPEKIFFKSFYYKDDFAEYSAEYPNWPSLPITEEIKEFYEKAGGKGIAVVKSKEMSVYIGVRRRSSPDEMTLLEGLRFAKRHGQLSSASRILREQGSSNEDFIEAVIDNKEELGQAYATELSGSKIHILGKVLHYGNDTYFQVIVNVVEDKWSDYQDIALSVINSMRTEVTTKEAQEEEKKEKEQLFPYRVEYKPIVRSGFPFLLVDVRGPADELGIILTNPEGWSTTTFISKRDLIDNFESVEVFMCEGRNPPAGKYKLVIKTITPEKVVYKTEARFTPPAVEITNAELKLGKTGGVYWDTGMRYYTKEFSVTVKNSGELPIFLNKAVIIIPSSMSPKIQKIEITLIFAGVPYGETVIEDEGNYGYLESRGNPYGNKIQLYSEGKEVASSSMKVTVVE